MHMTTVCCLSYQIQPQCNVTYLFGIKLKEVIYLVHPSNVFFLGEEAVLNPCVGGKEACMTSSVKFLFTLQHD